MEVGQLEALGCELVEVWGFDGFGAKAAQVAVALVIGEDDDEVRIARQGRRAAEDGEKEKLDDFHIGVCGGLFLEVGLGFIKYREGDEQDSCH